MFLLDTVRLVSAMLAVLAQIFQIFFLNKFGTGHILILVVFAIVFNKFIGLDNIVVRLFVFILTIVLMCLLSHILPLFLKGKNIFINYSLGK